MSEELIVVGRVRTAFGIKGQLSVDWNDGKCPVKLGKDLLYLEMNGKRKRFTVMKDHRHGNHNVITLEGVDSRTDAEMFRGSFIWVEQNELPKLGVDEFYTYQLIDMKVETVSGEYLGKIAEIFSTGGNDVYVVKDGKKEILIPAIKDIVREIDLEKGVMVVELLEGLR